MSETLAELFTRYKKESLPIIKVLELPTGGVDDPIVPNVIYSKKNSMDEAVLYVSNTTGTSLLPLFQRDSLTSVLDVNELRSLQVDRPTICFVMNDNEDPSADASSGFYFFSSENNEWVKFSSDIFGNIEEKDGSLIYKGKTIALASTAETSSTVPMIDTLEFEFITSTMFSLKTRLATLNGYYPDGLKIVFQTKYIGVDDVWVDIFETPFVSRTMDYGFIYTSLDQSKTHLFRVLMLDSNNPGLKIESSVITGNNSTSESLPDVILTIEGSNINRFNMELDNGGIYGNVISEVKTIIKNNDSVIRSVVIKAPDVEQNFGNVKMTYKVHPKRYYQLGSSPERTVTSTKQFIVSKDPLLNKLTYVTDAGVQHDVTPVNLPTEINKFYLGSDHVHNPFQHTEKTNTPWSTVSAVLATDATYRNDMILDDITVLRISGEGSTSTSSYAGIGIYSPESLYFNSAASISARMPKALRDFALLKTNKYVFVLGGEFTDGTGYNTKIYRVEIEKIMTSPAYIDTGKTNYNNTGVKGHLAVPIKNFVYLIGGHDQSSVFRAVILESGDITNFELYRTNTPLRHMYSQAIVTEKKLYILGGSVYDNPINTIYVADINEDGSLGEITPYGTLPYSVTGHKCVNSANTAYVIGGQLHGSSQYSDDVLVYDITDTFDLVFSGYDLKLPYRVAFGNVYVNQSSIVYLGGYNGVYQKSIIYRSTHGWKNNRDPRYITYEVNLPNPTADLPKKVYNPSAKTQVYMGDTFNFKANINQANIDKETATQTLSSWLTVPVTFKHREGSVFAFNNSVYLLNGYVDTTNFPIVLKGNYDENDNITDVVYHDINPSLSRNTVPIKLYNKVHLIGINSGFLQRYAKLNENGNYDSWQYTTTTPPDPPRVSAKLEIIGQYLYMFGMSSTGIKINRANLNFDGTINSFERLTLSTPNVFLPHFCFKTHNRLYIFPDNGTIIYYSVIDSSNNLTTWINAEINLPFNLKYYQVLVTKKKVWVIGGMSGSVLKDTVFSSTINNSGIMSPWVTEPSLPVPLVAFNIVVLKSKLYLIGGQTSTGDSNKMYSCSFDGWEQSYITGNHDDAVNELLPTTIDYDTVNDKFTVTTEMLTEVDPCASIGLKVNSGDSVSNLTGFFWYT